MLVTASNFAYAPVSLAVVSAQRFSYTALHLASRTRMFVHASYNVEWSLFLVLHRSSSSLDREAVRIIAVQQLYP
jgi:hypothetical protein